MNQDNPLNDGVDAGVEPIKDDKEPKTVPLAELINERKKRQSLETRIADIERLDAESKEAKLKEEGKIKELLAAKENELKVLQPKVQEFESYRQSKVEQLKLQIGDKWKDSFANLPLADLETLTETLKPPIKVLDVDKGASIPQSTNVQITEEQKKEALTMFPYASEKDAIKWFNEILEDKKKRK